MLLQAQVPPGREPQVLLPVLPPLLVRALRLELQQARMPE
jgi:hypothetical protein